MIHDTIIGRPGHASFKGPQADLTVDEGPAERYCGPMMH